MSKINNDRAGKVDEQKRWKKETSKYRKKGSRRCEEGEDVLDKKSLLKR